MMGLSVMIGSAKQRQTCVFVIILNDTLEYNLLLTICDQGNIFYRECNWNYLQENN